MSKRLFFMLSIAAGILINCHSASALELPKTDKISFSASANRQDIPSAFGLYNKEAVVDYSNFTVKVPSGMTGKKADFKEANIAVSPFKNLTLSLKSSKNHSEGSTRSWDTKSDEYGYAYKVYEAPNNNSAISILYKNRDIDPQTLKIKATGQPTDPTFLVHSKAYTYGLAYSKIIDLKKTYHLNYENIKVKYDVLETSTDKFGLGYDFIPNILKNKLKIEANLIYLKNNYKKTNNNDLPASNQIISGRMIYNVGNGFNLSFDGGMYTKGMPMGGLRFSDQGFPTMIYSSGRLEDMGLKKFVGEKFGYYGVTLTYGVKF